MVDGPWLGLPGNCWGIGAFYWGLEIIGGQVATCPYGLKLPGCMPANFPWEMQAFCLEDAGKFCPGDSWIFLPRGIWGFSI